MNSFRSSQSTSTSLVRRIKESDSEAWRRFCLLYSPLLFSWLKKSQLQHADASEVVQEILLSVSKAIARYDVDKGSGFRGWLWGITRNKLLQYESKNRRCPDVVGGSTAYQSLQQLSADPPDQLRESLAIVAHRAAALIQTDFRPNTWQAFWRVTVEGEDPAQVAADLGMKVAAIYTAKSRVLAHLRSELEGLLEDGQSQ